MVASSIDVEEEASIVAGQAVNDDSYVRFHNGQIFEDGLSFSGFERNKTWINAGGSFADLSDVSGADTPNDSRATVAADFDGDGDVDLFVHSIQRERHALYRNDAVERPATRSVKVRLRATRSHYEAIGATVVARGPAGPTAQVLARGSGFLSCQPPELTFGLGGAATAEVEVVWPGGEREAFGALGPGTVLLVEGSGAAEPVEVPHRPLPDPLPPGLSIDEGDPVPTLTLVDANGEPATLDPRALADGKPLFLNLWASYCAPCVAELPLLAELAARGEANVAVISVDAPGAVARARKLLESAGADFPAFYLGDDPQAAIGELVDLERLAIPTTLVLTPEGRVETILRGPLEAPKGR